MEKNTLENLVPGTEPKHNLPKTMRAKLPKKFGTSKLIEDSGSGI